MQKFQIMINNEKKIRTDIRKTLAILINLILSDSEYKELSYEFENNNFYINKKGYPATYFYNDNKNEVNAIFITELSEFDFIGESVNFVNAIRDGSIMHDETYKKDYEFFSDIIENEEEKSYKINIFLNLETPLNSNEFQKINENLNKLRKNNENVDFIIETTESINFKIEEKSNIEFNENEVLSISDMKYNFDFKTPISSTENIIKFNTKTEKIYVIPISAASLVSSFKKYGNLMLERNVRFSVESNSSSIKNVDEGIKKTIEENPNDFFMLNNGITITALGDVKVDEENHKISLEKFNIVNGAQTLTQLYKYCSKKNNIFNSNLVSEIFILAKIISPIDEFCEDFNKKIDQITRAANSQKPIEQRDFYSNSQEMLELREEFKNNGLILEIKRGQDNERIKKEIESIRGKDYIIPKNIDNGVLGQNVCSTMIMQPYKSFQIKKKIFDVESNYKLIFKNNKIKTNDFLEIYKFYNHHEQFVKKIMNTINFKNNKEYENFVSESKTKLIVYSISIFYIISANIKNMKHVCENGSKFISEKNVMNFENLVYVNLENPSLASKELISEIFLEAFNLFTKKTDNKGKPYTKSAFFFKEETFYSIIESILMPKFKGEQELKNKISDLQQIFK
ncbi:AIPR family protein [Mesoplasma photuris]|uniref:AIPR family protein n=1 Tax=Mesoplasma photuris TaxID=217731 RepID=UPI0004E0F9A6|nr:AIPR family protein [Mesoplasma photuris]